MSQFAQALPAVCRAHDPSLRDRSPETSTRRHPRIRVRRPYVAEPTAAETPKNLSTGRSGRYPERPETGAADRTGSHKAFYRPNLNKARGADKIARHRQALLQSLKNRQRYHGFLFGHPGCGKSTELTRLALEPEISQKFEIVRFSLSADLDAENYKPFDVLLLMVAELVERTNVIAPWETCSERARASIVFEEVNHWFARETVTATRNSRVVAQ